jgi:thiosulfate/3-mercaptopyruvate sulfurtransferase
MKKINYLLAIFTMLVATTAFIDKQTEPWRTDQLMEPKDLAAIINDSTAAKPLIISVGPAGLIKAAISIGPVNKKENLSTLKQLLSKESKDKEIVIYCGCCPFQNCPNIRPAFSLLNSMKFTKHKLLDLPHNLKADWIDHGYPMND